MDMKCIVFLAILLLTVSSNKIFEQTFVLFSSPICFTCETPRKTELFQESTRQSRCLRSTVTYLGTRTSLTASRCTMAMAKRASRLTSIQLRNRNRDSCMRLRNNNVSPNRKLFFSEKRTRDNDHHTKAISAKKSKRTLKKTTLLLIS